MVHNDTLGVHGFFLLLIVHGEKNVKDHRIIHSMPRIVALITVHVKMGVGFYAAQAVF